MHDKISEKGIENPQYVIMSNACEITSTIYTKKYARRLAIFIFGISRVLNQRFL